MLYWPLGKEHRGSRQREAAFGDEGQCIWAEWERQDWIKEENTSFWSVSGNVSLTYQSGHYYYHSSDSNDEFMPQYLAGCLYVLFTGEKYIVMGSRAI